MSNAQEHQEEHGSLIKTPKQLIVTIFLSFAVPIAILIMLANMVNFGGKEGAGSDAMTAAAVDKRIAPLAHFEYVDANAPRVFKTGEEVFKAVCTACHTAGVAGAPKIGDKAAWAPRIKTGYDELIKAAIHGKGAMPPKGGNPQLSDYEVERAVVYMTGQSGGSFPEPKAPAPQAANGAAAAPAATASAAPAPAPVPVAAAAAPKAPAQAAAPAAAPKATASADQATVDPAGEKLYKSTCVACHGAGVAGAPKFGNKADWAPRIALGMDALIQVAMHGKGVMPPKGGAINASDSDIRAAVAYMVNAAK